MDSGAQRRLLTRLLLLSVAAGIATIGLKTLAWRLTGSTGLLSDALESVVNLAAALIALAVVRWATLPPDEEHMYGHEKAEYFSAGVEGGLILVAAGSIAWVAIKRLLHPVPLEDVGVGLAVTAAASVINLLVGVTLVRAGRRHRSITVEADGRHLLTDVWTSVGVIAGVTVVALTGWERLDPLIALAVAANIVFTGIKLIRRASGGLMDRALPPSRAVGARRSARAVSLPGSRVPRNPQPAVGTALVRLDARARPGRLVGAARARTARASRGRRARNAASHHGPHPHRAARRLRPRSTAQRSTDSRRRTRRELTPLVPAGKVYCRGRPVGLPGSPTE